MKEKKSHLLTIIFTMFLVISFISCGSKENSNDEADSLKTDEESTVEIKNNTPILDYLRALPEDEYGGTDHIKASDFKTIDNSKRYVEYQIEKEDRYYHLQFVQVSSEPRNLFLRLSYDKYSMGANDGYNAFNHCQLIEKKENKWINVSNELPENWTKDYYTAEYDDAKSKFSLYQVDFDTETGKVINKKIVETAKWQNDKLDVISSNVEEKEISYKIIVAFSETEDVSEDFNYIFNDVDTAFKKFGVYIEYLNLSESKVIKIDDKDLSLELDLTEIMTAYEKEELGYLFLENGKDAQFVKYQESEFIILEAQKYFGLHK